MQTPINPGRRNLNSPLEGMGAPPDSKPPADLDWELWQGPAPAHPYNENRFTHGNFRRFWDYAGGSMTDWGVHWLDIVQMAFDEVMPKSIVALGGKFGTNDNRETPDTLLASFEYPGFTAFREYNLGGENGGITFHGIKATLFVNRSVCRVTPEKNSDVQPFEMKRACNANLMHWANFLDCVKTRRKPVCDIEIGRRSSTTCLLGNVAFRSKLRVDWDVRTVRQPEARKFLGRKNRHPWEVTV